MRAAPSAGSFHGTRTSPIRVDETNRFMIWGVVTYVIHQIAE